MRWVRSLLLASAVAATAPSATAADLLVTWEAPSCAAESAFRNQVRDALRREPEQVLTGELRVAIEIAENEAKIGFWMQIRTDQGARRLETPSCEEAVTAAAIIVALLIDPNAVAAVADPAAPPAPSAPAGRSPPAPEPAPPAPPEGLAPYVALFGGASIAEVPALSPLLGAAVGLRFGGWGLAAEGFWSASQTELLPTEPSKGGAVGLAGGGVMLCYSPLRDNWRLSGCVGGQAGAWRSRGVGVQNPREQADLWLAALGRLSLGYNASQRWGLFLNADMVVPARRPLFRLTDLGGVFRPEAVGGRLSAGAELRF